MRAARPKQWIKNGLVLAAPALGGALGTADGLASALIALVAFTLASAGTYLINDARDAEADRLHPVKRLRPIAAGTVSVRTGYTVGGLLMIGALVLGALTLPHAFLGVLAAYLIVTLLYMAGVKDVPIWEMAFVAAGFVLRLVGGGAATGTRLSGWFLVVGGATAFFIVVTKRKAEIAELELGASRHRPSLAGYSHDILLVAQAVSFAVAITAYALWSFTGTATAGASIWLELSIVPLFMIMLRFGQQAEVAKVSAPEEILFRDPQLVTMIVLWLVLVVVGTGIHS